MPARAAHSHWASVGRFPPSQRQLLRHAADIPIHNNDTERDIRHAVTGRKNWMFFGSPRGGEVAGRHYSLVMSCKFASVDPAAYLEDALSLVSSVKATDIAILTPWGWKAMRAADSSCN